ncbi:MAG: hypothetical protein V1790_00480 [Planctomycetota bacterium]
MLYLAIDQHRKQLTVNLRNEQGDVLLKRQVSTQWLRVRKFLEDVRKQSPAEGGFVAILEVCGFNDWQPPCERDAGDRQITALRKRLGQLRTRTINKVKHILRKHNLEQECPTKGIGTIQGKKWLIQLALGVIDRLEMDQLLAQWQLWDEQIAKVETRIQKRQAENKTAAVLATIPGCAA